jgi:hypothetical protein
MLDYKYDAMDGEVSDFYGDAVSWVSIVHSKHHSSHPPVAADSIPMLVAERFWFFSRREKRTTTLTMTRFTSRSLLSRSLQTSPVRE